MAYSVLIGRGYTDRTLKGNKIMKLVQITESNGRIYINTTRTVVAQGFNAPATGGMPQKRIFHAGQKIKCKDINHAKMIASRIEKTAFIQEIF